MEETARREGSLPSKEEPKTGKRKDITESRKAFAFLHIGPNEEVGFTEDAYETLLYTARREKRKHNTAVEWSSTKILRVVETVLGWNSIRRHFRNSGRKKGGAQTQKRRQRIDRTSR